MSRSERSEEDRVVAKAVALAEIPVIDFSPFLTGGAEARQAVADEIAGACREIGFFYLAGHGVPEPLTGEIFSASKSFFHSPVEERRKAQATADWYRGWIPAPSLSGRDTRMFDQYRLQSVWPAQDRPANSMDRIFDAPNRWPENMPAFRQTVENYLAAMHRLSIELLSAFALGLGLPETRFHDWFRRPPCQLSLLYYPPLPPQAEAEVSNIVSHTDEGPFTILAQGEIGGLEVKRRDGVWIAAPPIAGAFTINVGDMMMWWSNGIYLSNFHRVRNRSGGERFSIPFFANPDRDVVVEPLPELLERTGPALYQPVKVSDHLARFYAKLEQAAHAKQ